MKKLVSILLALALILSLSVTAFATTLTIADGDAVTRTYNGYRLLDLTVSLKSDCGCPEGTTTHKDECYNYAYTVNTTYATILQELAGEGNDIIKYLSELKSDDEGATLRPVAEQIYDKIKGMDPDARNLTGSGDNIDQGYWLFADVTDLDEKEEANSLVIVDTKGKESLTITPKTGLPTLVKKVKDINDTTGVTTDWQDSADHDINDTVDFQLTATMPENIASYDTYQIIFHDTLSAGLTLKPDTIKVMVGETDVTDSFDTPETATSPFEISCEDILSIEGIEVDKDTKFVVTYSATLNENAVIGAAGNPNTAYLEFSNNPYDDGTGKTKEDKVIVFTYQLVINKVDDKKQPLKGAGFTLSKKNEEGTYTAIGEELKGGDMTTFTWQGLDDGDYKLEETTVPAGYNKMADIEFAITATHDEEADNPTLTELEGGTLATGVVATGEITKDIVNLTGTVLPETGAEGTIMLLGASSMLVMVAVVFMVTRKKMSIYED